MAFSGRAWAVRGAKVPSNIARRVAYGATGGGNGVLGIGDLLVTATPTPSGSVRIMPGGVAMVSRYPGVKGETYIDSNDTAIDFPIAPTTSLGGRTDYLVARIKDPQFESFTPVDPKLGPFTFVEALTTDPRVNPPAYPFFLAAVITIPKSTATITPDMIDSSAAVREMANPRSKPMTLAWNGGADSTGNPRAYPLTNTNGAATSYWLPETATYRILKFEIPEWCGQINLTWTFGNVFVNAYDVWGWYRIRMVDPANPSTNWADFPKVDFDIRSGGAAWAREAWAGGGRIAVPRWARGKTVEFRPLAAKVGGNQTASEIYLGSGSSVTLNATLFESAVDDVF